MVILQRMEDRQFLTTECTWSKENPEAWLFNDEDHACDLARSLPHRIRAIRDYGLETEQVILDVK